MSGNSFVLDTNIVLYLLSGNTTVAEIVDGSQCYISFITQLELLGYKDISSKEQQKVKAFLVDCIIVDITEEIKKNTIALKQKYQIKLPDSIIAATAQFLEIPLLTADKGFIKLSGLNIALYQE
jgi:predicted nucleic acid-binding protein